MTANQADTDFVIAIDSLIKPVIHYIMLPFTKELKSKVDSIFNDDKLKIIYALNRIDRKHIVRLDSIIVPDTFFTDIKLYSPFPDTLKFAGRIPRLIFYSYTIQAFAAYENGCLLRWGPVSMGKRATPTPTGLFHTNWKAKTTVSTVNSEWVMNWYFNLMNFKGVSMHEFDLPGYPASHACIRLLAGDAKWLYYWAEQWKLSANGQILVNGTPVLIYGSFNYDSVPPWRQLVSDDHYTDQSAELLEKELSPYIKELTENINTIVAER